MSPGKSRQATEMKPELEFHELGGLEWRQVTAGVKSGKAWEKILSNDPDTGAHSRLYRLEPGCETDTVLSHDFWEEVYIIEGSLIDTRLGGKGFAAGTYACRPPGMLHGPYRSPGGCTTFEVRYYSSH